MAEAGCCFRCLGHLTLGLFDSDSDSYVMQIQLRGFVADSIVVAAKHPLSSGRSLGDVQLPGEPD